MPYYSMRAKLLAPMMIQQSRQSNASSALPYLPGSTMRGAVAAAMIRGGIEPEEATFQKVFHQSPIPFPNLVPAPDPVMIMRPLPASAISCKRKPGFRGNGHGVADVLPAIAAARMNNRISDSGIWKCSRCHQDMKPFSGFWNGEEHTPETFEPTLISHRHTGIDRGTGTIATSIFFMTQAIADFYKPLKGADQGGYRQQFLTGSLFMTEDQAILLEPVLKDPIFVGAERTRGMGEVQLYLSKLDSAPDFDLMNWSRSFKARLSRLIKTDEKELPGIYFSILLESHALLADAFLRPVSRIEELEDREGDDFCRGVEPVARITSGHTVRGWQSAWKMAKPDETAVAMGSLFLYRYTGDDPDRLERRLQQLLQNGVGLRREEGFGRISICDPLHIREEEL